MPTPSQLNCGNLHLWISVHRVIINFFILIKACIAGVVREQIRKQSWIQHVENPLVQIFGAIGATSGV